MKKFFFGILIVLLVLGSLIYYQRNQVAGSLREILKGKTYSSYGIKIQVPAAKSGVRGWLKPYVNIPRVIIDLGAWGFGAPLQLENAVAFRDLWGNGALLIEIPRDWQLGAGVMISHPVFELGMRENIKIIGAKSISVQGKQQKLLLISPQLLLGPLAGSLPDYLAVKFQGVELDDKLFLNAFEIGVDSQTSDDQRSWKVYSTSSGGLIKTASGESQLGGWRFSLHGLVREAPFTEGLALFKQVRAAWPQENPTDSKLPNDGEKEFNRSLLAFFESLQSMADQLALSVVAKDLTWDGIKKVGLDGQEEILIRPLTMEGRIQERAGALFATAKANLDRVYFNLDHKIDIDAKGIGFTQESTFKNTKFSQLLHYFLSYYRYLFSKMFSAEPQKKFEGILFSSLAQYPNRSDFRFTIDKLAYQTKKGKGSHQNLLFEFFIHSQEAGYRVSDQFSFEYFGAKEKNIKGGSGTVAILAKFPWDGMINISRQAINDPNMQLDFFEIFGKQNAGLEFLAKIDLGANYFGVDIDSKLSLPLGPVLRSVGAPKDWGDPQAMSAWWQGLQKSALEKSVEKGYFLFNLKIERLSKFQGFLEAMQSGASLGLALIVPYVTIDSAADTLQVKLEFQDSQVKINGNPNQALQDLLTPYLKENGIALPTVATPTPATTPVK